MPKPLTILIADDEKPARSELSYLIQQLLPDALLHEARNGSEAWIGQGLAEGATVVVYPAAGLVDGARITSATR